MYSINIDIWFRDVTRNLWCWSDHVDCIVADCIYLESLCAEQNAHGFFSRRGVGHRQPAEDYDSCTQRSDGSGTLCGWKDKVP